jgi:hypothetical protein
MQVNPILTPGQRGSVGLPRSIGELLTQAATQRALAQVVQPPPGPPETGASKKKKTSSKNVSLQSIIYERPKASAVYEWVAAHVEVINAKDD